MQTKNYLVCQRLTLTLILSFATPSFLIQVSDTRLTLIDSRGQESYIDNNTTKQTIFCNRMVFAYSGLARIESIKTDVWLTRKLSEISVNSLSDVFSYISDQATKTFRRLAYRPKFKRLAFVGVGWTSSSPDSPILPIICRISNCHDQSGNMMRDANDSFELQYKIYQPPEPVGWLETGASMSRKQISGLNRMIKQCAKREASPMAVVRLLETAIRDVAANNKTVGENLLTIVIPKSVADHEAFFVRFPTGWGFGIGKEGSDAPDDDFPAEGAWIYSHFLPKNSSHGVEYGPNFVCEGSALADVSKQDLDR